MMMTFLFLFSMILVFFFFVLEEYSFMALLCLIFSSLIFSFLSYIQGMDPWWIIIFLLVFVVGILMIFSFMVSFNPENPFSIKESSKQKMILFKVLILLCVFTPWIFYNKSNNFIYLEFLMMESKEKIKEEKIKHSKAIKEYT
uniref:NADH dehydrogenase subunit 6 n=1 Tax=Macrogyropus costalimai TaxID=1941320 RepID=A0A7S5WS49_9NEOP|nr:NADH dehydrogenase subunit 6 [Macrogyropus costalimai]